ncbi:cupin domain-containing protein [Arenibaculum pallidiluteum]|uniref:cupin domain-containing protein n=1 Tax=Arenibaculum pallidiluteum TaxID=2812559 RepID=UPI001A978877|nr:cupin domain-containing protein [Arenibaculum pallidiluteum]
MSVTADPRTDSFVRDSKAEWEDLGAGVRRKILGYSDAMMMTRVAFEKGAVGPLHSHPHSQSAIIESGVFDVTIDGRTERMGKGDGYIVKSNVVHGVVAIEAGVLLDIFTPPREDFLG